MKTFCFLILTVLGFNNIQSQIAPNFTVTDIDGKVHRLYEDYLNQGKVVALKLFFVDCPPCNTIAPLWQQKYVQHGSGTGNVEFLELSTKLTDSNNKVRLYKNSHSLTMPSIGGAGGSVDAVTPYTNGTLGQWSGTPFFAVIAPNKTLFYDVSFDDISTTINQAKTLVTNPPNMVSVTISFPSDIPSTEVAFILKPKNAASPTYRLPDPVNGLIQFSYPSTSIPEMVDPTIVIESTKTITNTLINVGDAIAVRKHIIKTENLTQQEELIAADVNGDGKISVADVILIQKIIIKLVTVLPNNQSVYKMLPAELPLNVPLGGGSNIQLNPKLVKLGNIK